MPLLHADPSRTFSLHGVEFTSLASSATGATALAAWRADFPPQTPGAPHRMDSEEVLLVTGGTLRVQIDDESHVVTAGDAMLVPAEASFCVSNDSDAPASLWATTALGMTACVDGSADVLRPPWAQ